MSQSTFYVGYKSCGCPTAFMRAGGAAKRIERSELKRWAGSGYRIEIFHGDADTLNALPNFMHCPHGSGSTPDEIDELIERARNG